jgi:hypothetical protein
MTPHFALYFQAETLTNNKSATLGIFADPTGNGAFPRFTNPRFLTSPQPFGFSRP